jgi:hypothetical protein
VISGSIALTSSHCGPPPRDRDSLGRILVANSADDRALAPACPNQNRPSYWDAMFPGQYQSGLHRKSLNTSTSRGLLTPPWWSSSRSEQAQGCVHMHADHVKRRPSCGGRPLCCASSAACRKEDIHCNIFITPHAAPDSYERTYLPHHNVFMGINSCFINVYSVDMCVRRAVRRSSLRCG